jgi:soluble lytic murein transglycosylase
MPIRRSHLFLLLGAVAALMPGVVGGADLQLTAAIPMPGLQDSRPTSPPASPC